MFARFAIPALRRLAFCLPLLLTAATGAEAQSLTFSRDIAPILQANCQECHRPGGIGPFSLLTYADARDRAASIKEYTSRRIMPPWKAAEGYGEFQDPRRLSTAQIDAIAKWVDAGTPEGDPKDLPAPREFASGWNLGQPDLVLDAGEAFTVPKSGDDIYRDFVLPYSPDEDRWVNAIEVVPGNAAVVHHVVLYLDPEGVAAELDDRDPGPGFTVFGADAGFEPAIWVIGWAPGASMRPLPSGMAWRIPAGARLVMQVHYHPHGHEVKDLTRVGIHFAKGAIDKRVRTSAIANDRFVIPAGAARHRVTAGFRLPGDITLLGLWPHMHQIGKEMRVSATTPSGSLKPLVWIPEWDFNWQLTYMLKEPLKLPFGTLMSLTATYDNSADNPFNPNSPPKEVRFGPQTTDEMCFCFFLYTVDDEHILDGQPVDDDPLEIRR